VKKACDIRYSFEDIEDKGGHLKTLEDTKNGGKSTVKLVAVKREWLSNSTCSFPHEQVDRGRVLTPGSEKKQRTLTRARHRKKTS